MRPLFRTMQVRLDTVNRVLREQITGNRVIRAFVRDEYEKERFREANADLTEMSLATGRLMALMFPIVMTVVNLSSIAVVWFGAHRIDSGGMQIGALTAFLAYLMQIVMSVMMATFMFMMVPRAEVCAERIEEVLDTESQRGAARSPRSRSCAGTAIWRSGARSSATRAPRSRCCRASTWWRGPGETTAVIGSTGSGKSTLLGLVPRLFDATDGEVLVDGVDVRDARPGAAGEDGRAWCRRSRTCSPARSRPTCATAIRTRPTRSCGTRWRWRRPRTSWSGWRTGWTRPSRRAARTSPAVSGSGSPSRGRWCSGPEIYLFDDSFSALDYATDAALRAALARETAEATVVIVAQRVSTIRDADRIVVLDEGRVVGHRHAITS